MDTVGPATRSLSPPDTIPDSDVSPIIAAILYCMGETLVSTCPPPVAEMSRLCATTALFALDLKSNHFFLYLPMSASEKMLR